MPPTSRRLRHALAPGGQAIFGVFAPEAPPLCSGLEVRRYTPEGLRDEIGSGFVFLEQRRELHVTPGGVEQSYVYCRFRRSGE